MFERVRATTSSELSSPIVELRQYTLHPGRREQLIETFDGHLIEGQEEAGMTIIGQFRDLNDAEKFVWLRGFDDMDARKASLGAFYGGQVWEANKDAANATMTSSDDVLLLRPAWPGSAFDLTKAARGPRAGKADAIITAAIFHVASASEGEFTTLFQREASPLLAGLGAPVIAAFVTEHAENSFPRLPVRAGENVFIAFFSFGDSHALAGHEAALERDAEWANDICSRLRGHFSKPMEGCVLPAPTVRFFEPIRILLRPFFA